MSSRRLIPRWRPSVFSANLPYRGWLLKRGSLTQHIQRCCEKFRVRLVNQRLAQPHSDERGLLGLREGEWALVREVFLYCGDDPVVFGRSVLPMKHLRGDWRALGELGDRPLGAALFANPLIQRTRLRFRQLDRQHALYRSAWQALHALPDQLWARRSLFILGGKPILVTEVFLPDILNLKLHLRHIF